MTVNARTLACAAVGTVTVAWLATHSLMPVPPVQYEPGVPASEFMHSDARILAKTAVGRELLASRLSLREAAAVFEWLHRLPPAIRAEAMARSLDAAADDRPAVTRSEDELLREYVIAWVECQTCAEQALPGPRRPAEPVGEQLRRAREVDRRVGLPAVIEADCRELLARARASVAAARDHRGPYEPVSLDGLRLVQGRCE